MTTPSLHIAILHDRPEEYLERLRSRFPDHRFEVARNDREVEQLFGSASPDILLSYRCDGISTAAQTEAARQPGLRWIQVAGAGYDHIGALADINCPVTTCAGVLSRFHAETVMGGIINLNFGFFRYQAQQRSRLYRKLPWQSLEGRRLLLVGLGHIGRAVAAHARRFGMRVSAVRSSGAPSPEVDAVHTPDRLIDLLAKADFVSLHLPLNPGTRGMFSAEHFDAMQARAFFINTARGPIIDEDALIRVLREKRIAGAWLDVFEKEPLPESSPLWELDNLLITPHYCDAVEDWRSRFADFFADNLKRFLLNEPLENLLNKPATHTKTEQ